MNENLLINGKLGKLMRKYAIPCIISLLVGALYNIVDQIFISNASYLGSNGNAANTVVFPLTVIALGIAVCIGDGTCAFVSISLGEKNPEKAHKSVGSAILLTVILSIVLTLIYLIFFEPILIFFGGKVNDQTYALSKEYFFYITLGIPFYMFGQAINPIIRADGNPKFAMASTLAGAIINIILDPIFIYPLHMGMMGAAIATVIGQVATAAMAVWYLFHMKTIKLHKNSFGLWWNLIRRSISLGLTSFIAQISLVLSMAAFQNMCMKYGALDPIFGQEQYAQIPLAVLGIVMKFYQIAISISIGLAAGCIPVVGFNMGAGKFNRVKGLFTRLLLTELAIGFVALFIVEVFPGQLIAIFGASNESSYYTDFAIKSFRIYLCLMPLSMMNKGTFIFLQAMGKAVLSTIVTVTREVIMGVSLPILLPIFFGLDGILYSFPASDFLTTIVAGIIIIITYKNLTQMSQKQLLNN